MSACGRSRLARIWAGWSPSPRGFDAVQAAGASYCVTVTRLATTLSLASSASIVNYQAKVTVTVISGYYASETYEGSLYRVYRHTATLADTATVAPDKHGKCGLFQVQVYFHGTWTADVTTGCGTLSSSSQVYGRFNLATAAGARYRIRAVYNHTNGDVTNASAPSGWLYFRVAS